ncbi:MAG: Lrp/AsnC family transcriptional regulator [Candidatus Bathyarchaeia archaeon]
MDEVDREILRLLREDGRMKMTLLAKRLGLTEGAVRKRIQALVQSGTIRRFTISTVAEQGVKAVTLVSSSASVRTPEIAEKIRGVEGVESVYEVTGQYDIAVILSGGTVADLNKTIDEIRRIPGVVGTNTLISLRIWE